MNQGKLKVVKQEIAKVNIINSSKQRSKIDGSE